MLEHFGFRDMERPKKVSEHQYRCLLMLKTLVGRLMHAVELSHTAGLTCSELAPTGVLQRESFRFVSFRNERFMRMPQTFLRYLRVNQCGSAWQESRPYFRARWMQMRHQQMITSGEAPCCAGTGIDTSVWSPDVQAAIHACSTHGTGAETGRTPWRLGRPQPLRWILQSLACAELADRTPS
jgi:hypothetical protein